MKEQFRSKIIGKHINLKLKLEDGIYRWKADTYELLAHCRNITEEYMKMKIKITLRQLYYDLVSTNVIPNHDVVYKRISSLLTDARYLGLIDWSAIEDRNRPHRMHMEWENTHDAIQFIISRFRLPRWSDQEYYLELFTEKDALSSIIQPVCDNWHIRFNVNKGYSSASIMYQLGKRIAKKIEEEEKEVILIYIGDHDPSGLDMVRDIDKRIIEFLEEGDFCYDSNMFHIRHIALTMDQVKELNPPPNPAKITDPRAKWYIQKYGKTSWEVEALKPKYLMNLVNIEIQRYVNNKKYDSWIKQEEEEKQDMRNFAKQYKNKGKAK